MNRRKEPCRNFQRGSCQYGDRCKFLHVSQQQPKSNPFGFGTQSTSQFSQTSQQQKPNPFGFGVQNTSQLKATPDFGARHQSPSKPFENKWIRPSSTPTGSSTPFKQADTQLQPATHKCTDPELCKRQIVEDSKNEAPLWKLTCYGHCKDGPCDIIGDISYEELRAAAYEDARKGLQFQSIVERERNLLNSKLMEFNNLLRNPYVMPQSSSVGVNLFPGAKASTPSISAQSNAPPLLSSFSQLGASVDLRSNVSPQAAATPSSTVFGQPNLSKNNSQNSSGVEMKFGFSGAFGSQLPTQSLGASPGPKTWNFQNGVMANGNNQFSSPVFQPQFPSSNNQSSSFLEGPRVVPDMLHQAPVLNEREVSPDDSIWLKKEWAIGEIPEVAPPERFC